jgi:hypothetical protein
MKPMPHHAVMYTAAGREQALGLLKAPQRARETNPGAFGLTFHFDQWRGGALVSVARLTDFAIPADADWQARAPGVWTLAPAAEPALPLADAVAAESIARASLRHFFQTVC